MRKSDQFVLCVVVSSILVAAPRTAEASEPQPKLSVKLGPKGNIESLVYDSHEMLGPGSMPSLSMASKNRHSVKIPLTQAPGSATDGTYTQIGNGIEVVTDMQRVKDALNFTIDYRNTGTNSIDSIDYSPIEVRFPKRPIGNSWKRQEDSTVDTEIAPGVVIADWGDGKMILCMQPGSSNPEAVDAYRPTVMGFAAGNSVCFRTVFKPALEPSKTWTIHASLRFAPSETPTAQVAGDIYRLFTKANPAMLKWPDRRPIATVFLTGGISSWPTNPRGYFHDPTVNIATGEGKKAFEAKLMALADADIASMKKNGAQGMIVWDIEGREAGHDFGVTGDPRILPVFAPEMDVVADKFFKKFLDAGFRTGVVINPTILQQKGTKWMRQPAQDYIGEMSDKIAYAQKRWGCTLVYIDSPLKWPWPAPNGVMVPTQAKVMPSTDMRELYRRHPDVLIISEWSQPAYWAVCAPFLDLHLDNLKAQLEVRNMYPDAISVLATGYADIVDLWDGLLARDLAGDIYLIGTAHNDPNANLLGKMYQEAELTRRGASVNPGNFETLLASADPAARFAAVSGLKKPDATQTALLIKALNTEKEWPVRRKIIGALGESGDASAVPVLQKIFTDPNSDGLSPFAALALGRIGPAATQALVGGIVLTVPPVPLSLQVTSLKLLPVDPAALRFRDPQQATAAIRGLAASSDLAATPVLLALLDINDVPARSLVVRALGSRPSPEVKARLIALLNGSDESVLKEACLALGRSKDREVAKPLVDFMIRNTNEYVLHSAAADALEELTGLEYGADEKKWKQALDEGRLAAR